MPQRVGVVEVGTLSDALSVALVGDHSYVPCMHKAWRRFLELVETVPETPGFPWGKEEDAITQLEVSGVQCVAL